MCAESGEENGCVGTEWLYGYRVVMSVYQFLSLWLCGWLGATAHCQCPASQDLCAGPNIASLGKGQSSQFDLTIFAESVSLLHNCKAEKSLSQTIIIQGPFVYYQFMLYLYAYQNIIIVHSFALSLVPSVYIIF